MLLTRQIASDNRARPREMLKTMADPTLPE